MAVITLEEAKNYLKIDSADDNTLITSLIEAAEDYAEKFTSLTLLTTSFELIYDSVSSSIEIVKSPLQSVTKIEVISSAGVKTEVDSDSYSVDTYGQRGRVRLNDGYTWPNHRGFASFIIMGSAGFGDAADVPHLIKQAILQIIGHLYENRESGEIPKGIKAMFWPFKILRI